MSIRRIVWATTFLAVMDALKIERPVLLGHSLAGEELSYIGSRYPRKVAALVYLDAGYTYAFWDPSKPFTARPVAPGGSTILKAIWSGMQEFTKISAPTLAIVPYPHAPLPPSLTGAHDKAMMDTQIAVIKRDDPAAQIGRIPNASHYVFVSNEAAVLTDVHAFIDALPTGR